MDNKKKEEIINEDAHASKEPSDVKQSSEFDENVSGNEDEKQSIDEKQSKEEIIDEEAASEEMQQGEQSAESGFFKKKAKADKKQDALKQKIEELEDRNKRQMAEFENFRKRTDKEKSMMFETGAKSVLEKILPVIDNFERGLQSVPEEEKNTPFAEGMNMIYKQLMGELDAVGVKVIEAIGEEFNPDLHNAVMQVESEEYESGIVAQELQKGYLYRDTVLRYSMVAVVS